MAMLKVGGCVFAFSLILFFNGCASAFNRMAGIGVIEERKSGYDGSHTISVTPNFTMGFNGVMDVNVIKIGATWVDRYPSFASLDFEVLGESNEYEFIQIIRVDILVDGEESSFDMGPSSLSFESPSGLQPAYTTSKNSISIPLEYLRELTTAKDVNMRIFAEGNGGRGEEVDFDKVRRYGAPSAKATIINMIRRVDEYIKQGE